MQNIVNDNVIHALRILLSSCQHCRGAKQYLHTLMIGYWLLYLWLARVGGLAACFGVEDTGEIWGDPAGAPGDGAKDGYIRKGGRGKFW